MRDLGFRDIGPPVSQPFDDGSGTNSKGLRNFADREQAVLGVVQ